MVDNDSVLSVVVDFVTFITSDSEILVLIFHIAVRIVLMQKYCGANKLLMQKKIE